jgi:hypothetical protein
MDTCLRRYLRNGVDRALTLASRVTLDGEAI